MAMLTPAADFDVDAQTALAKSFPSKWPVPTSSRVIAAPTNQSMAPAPFIPEQAPPMLPMQSSMQMPATKGSGKGPSQMQMPAQQMSSMPAQGRGTPVDLQALIQGLMSSGLLGGL